MNCDVKYLIISEGISGLYTEHIFYIKKLKNIK